MALSTPGVGSGLDIGGIIDKLMTLERAPVSKIDTRLVELKAQVSAYGSLKSAVSTFRDSLDKLTDVSKFKSFTATSSAATVVTTSASGTAGKGIYNINVQRLAENHRMAAGTTYADTSSTLIGVAGDTMTIGVGTGSFTVDVGGKTLAGIRDAINSASSNAGVTASILKDDLGYRLSLSSNSTGSSKALSASYSGGDLFALQTLNTDRNGSGAFSVADLDAVVTLENTYTVTSSSNTLSDAIEGVSLNLVGAGTATVKVERDTGAVAANVQSMAKAYSSLIALTSKMSGEVFKSDNAAVRGIQEQMRNVLSANVSNAGTFTNPFQVGISTQKNGTLSVDSTVLNSAINNDPDSFANLFANSGNGLAVRLRSLADSFLATSGIIDGRSQGLETAIRSASDQKARMEQRLLIIQGRLTKQFNSLDSVVSGLQRTGQAVTAQLAALSAAQQSQR